ncbi:MAG: hypothetical protein GY854_19955 [Deltaproteobacteria bacterium]|nr:hypothetical protein [Deltaproteobacteria bacterium]
MVQQKNADRLFDGDYKKKSKGLALFHGWGVEYEEFECGPGNYTIAIVEFDDGTVGTVVPSLIKFQRHG